MLDRDIEYSTTNESLEAIVAGLDVSENDSILSIAGSGDQVFALLEFSKKVGVVDTNPHQIELLKKRISLIEKGNYDNFLDVKANGLCDGIRYGKRVDKIRDFNLNSRNEYFSKEGRLDRIRSKLSAITFERDHEKDSSERKFIEEYLANLRSKDPEFDKKNKDFVTRLRTDYIDGNASILGVAQQNRRYNKIYFSNVDFTYGEENEILVKIVEKLPINGLIYLSSSVIERRFEYKRNKFPSSLVIDAELTSKAIALEKKMICPWDPIVYRRI